MKKIFFSSFIAGLFSIPAIASAHAFGMKYTLPLPAWMYIYGGGAVVILSFLLIGYFAEHDRVNSSEDNNFKSSKGKAIPGILGIKRLLRFLSLLLLLVTVCAGVFGSQNPGINFAPTLFWIIFLIGCTYLVALLGNFWDYINPWRTIGAFIADFQPPFRYPNYAGYIPALIGYIILIWLELLSSGAAVKPRTLAVLLLLYTVITLVGCSLFGIRDWFRYGDFFSVFFNLLAKMSPIYYAERKLYFRLPFIGLLHETADRLSLVLFIIFMLSSTAFDGFRETVKASSVSNLLSFLPTYQSKQTIIFLGSFALFFLIYVLAIWFMKLVAKTNKTVYELLLMFAYSLIPIALAYNLAHYFTLLLVQGQEIIALMSDPFNLEWNLFNTANFTPNVGIIGAKAVWRSQLAFILIGHIAAVYIAHVVALRIYSTRKQAIISQLPMLVVMVLYTMAGLWILSQPLVGG